MERHLQRLAASAHHLGLRCDLAAIGAALNESVREPACERVQVRLVLRRDGGFTIETKQAPESPAERKWTVAVSRARLDPAHPLIGHKTTQRDLYHSELDRLHRLCGCNEVLFLNTRCEICEGTFTNVFVEIDGRLLTPRAECGLLPGTFRGHLLQKGEALEAVLPASALRAASRLFVGNSVRGLIEVELAAHPSDSNL